MDFVLTIPDEVVSDLQNGGAKSLSRRALELLAVDGYKAGELSEHQVRVMLGLADRFAVDAFLQTHEAYYDYTSEELTKDAAALEQLLQQHSFKTRCNFSASSSR